MLQRPQTLWILLAVVAAVCSFEFPFAVVRAAEQGLSPIHVDAGISTALILLTAVSVFLSGIIMMTYTNLVRQKTLCWLGIMLGVSILLLFLREWRNQPQAELSLTCILPLINPISLWLAWMSMDRDQKTLKKLSKKV